MQKMEKCYCHFYQLWFQTEIIFICCLKLWVCLCISIYKFNFNYERRSSEVVRVICGPLRLRTFLWHWGGTQAADASGGVSLWQLGFWIHVPIVVVGYKGSEQKSLQCFLGMNLASRAASNDLEWPNCFKMHGKGTTFLLAWYLIKLAIDGKLIPPFSKE